MKKRILIIFTFLFVVGLLLNFTIKSNNSANQSESLNVIMKLSKGGSGTCEHYCPNSGLGCLLKLNTGDWISCPDVWS